MKKIDLHIHTSPSKYEREFTFSLDTLKNYVETTKIDIIAITNHNHFDKEQFEEIHSSLNCTVYPGVEIDIEKSHMLLIVPEDSIEDLDLACKTLDAEIHSDSDCITFEKFTEIFPNYKDYILIPHIKKDPSMKVTTLEKFKGVIKTGEVKSAKKFEVAKKDKGLAPVFFSDLRMENDIKTFPAKQTYIDINTTEYNVLKNALTDKKKLYISNNKKADEFSFLPDGTSASTKLNVIMGKRSSGKTYNLKQIYGSKDFKSDNIKFVRQFSLTGPSEEDKFNELVMEEQQKVIDDYLEPLRKLTDTLLNEDKAFETSMNKYLSSLKDFATNQSLQDSYSKSKLFNEYEYSIQDNLDTKKVIDAVITLLDSNHNQNIISKYINKDSLKELLKELIIRRKEELLEYKLKIETNKIVKILKEKLTNKSSLTSVSSINLYDVQKSRLLIKNFNKICEELKKKQNIYESDIHRFKLAITKEMYPSVKYIKNALKTSIGLGDAFNGYYNNPYEYIHKLSEAGITKSDIYKSIISFVVKVYNESGFELSGGERAEYNLLKELNGAEEYDILLLDEPEASFDNPFIKDYIIDIIRDISQKTTVFITTHNNSLGVLLKPNKLIYTSKENDEFKVYTAEFGSKLLTTVDGDSIISYDTIMEVMEAGKEAYEERKQIYESFKN